MDVKLRAVRERRKGVRHHAVLDLARDIELRIDALFFCRDARQVLLVVSKFGLHVPHDECEVLDLISRADVQIVKMAARGDPALPVRRICERRLSQAVDRRGDGLLHAPDDHKCEDDADDEEQQDVLDQKTSDRFVRQLHVRINEHHDVVTA